MIGGKPQLTLAELNNIQKQRQTARGLSFDRALDMCHRRIRTIASYGGMNAFFEVPAIIIGFPLFKVAQCQAHIVEALRKSGFLVQILPPPHIAVIYISWDPKDVRPPVKKQAIESHHREGGVLRLF